MKTTQVSGFYTYLPLSLFVPSKHWKFQRSFEAEEERVRKDSRRVEVKRKHLGESERRFISEGEKEHLVRRYPGNARSSF
jgi:hypothetical protein